MNPSLYTTLAMALGVASFQSSQQDAQRYVYATHDDQRPYGVADKAPADEADILAVYDSGYLVGWPGEPMPTEEAHA